MGYFELKKNPDPLLAHRYYFVLKAANGETIAQSEMYATKQDAEAGIASVKANAVKAEIRDLANSVSLF